MKQADLISISEASQMLGVNEATLRQWTDDGKLKAFVTPGGHRRYSKSDLKKFTRLSQKVLGIKDLVIELEDTTTRHREIARSFISDTSQSARPDAAHQRQLADLGRRLLNLITRYVSEPAHREEILVTARDVGSGFGRVLAELDLPLTTSVEAFLVHRATIMQVATDLMGKRESYGGHIAQSIPLANRFLDETLVSMIASHQAYPAWHKEANRA
jgi:excisionase family DNA binding protein